MKPFGYVAGALASVILFAGCSGSSAPIGLPSGQSVGAAWNESPSRMSGETLSATKVTNSCNTFGSFGSVLQISFSATGNASGPFPGTFTLNGFIGRASAPASPRKPVSRNDRPDKLVGVAIHEHFVITSNSQQISGRVYDMRQADFKDFGCGSAGSQTYGYFVISGLKYQAKKLRAHGRTTEQLNETSYSESFH